MLVANGLTEVSQESIRYKKCTDWFLSAGAFSLSLFFCPKLALFYSCAVGSVSVDRVAGILSQQFAGNVGALAAVDKAFALTAHGHRALSVKWMAHGLDTAFAIVRFDETAAGAVKSAS